MYVCKEAGDREELVQCDDVVAYDELVVFKEVAICEVDEQRLMHGGSVCLRANVVGSGPRPTSSNRSERKDDSENIPHTSYPLSYTALWNSNAPPQHLRPGRDGALRVSPSGYTMLYIEARSVSKRM